MKQIFIHIGLPKTATTFIQQIVFPNIPTVYYIGRPYTQENYAFNLLQFADDLLYNPSFLKEELYLIGTSSSRKGFPKQFPTLKLSFFLRNQEDLILSLYNQYIKARTVCMKLDRSFISRPGSGYDLTDWNSGIKVFDLKKVHCTYGALREAVL